MSPTTFTTTVTTVFPSFSISTEDIPETITGAQVGRLTSDNQAVETIIIDTIITSHNSLLNSDIVHKEAETLLTTVPLNSSMLTRLTTMHSIDTVGINVTLTYTSTHTRLDSPPSSNGTSSDQIENQSTASAFTYRRNVILVSVFCGSTILGLSVFAGVAWWKRKGIGLGRKGGWE
jgi:hypothetical protein